MKIIIRSSFVLSIIIVCFTSCTKVINLDLNSANPNIVVDAEVTDQPGPYSVNLTKTINFSDNNVFPPIDGASVVISDNAGNSETLTETSAGFYTTSHLQGIVGRTYNISITNDGKNYSAISTMPVSVSIDSVIADTAANQGGGFEGGGKNGPPSVNIKAMFTDPAGIANYYRLIEYTNRVPNYKNISIVSDNLQDGSVITANVTRRDTTIHHGDSVTVILESIDANVYEYFRTLRQITRPQTGFQASVPGNPTTNLSNNALGFFSAHTIKKKTIVVP